MIEPVALLVCPDHTTWSKQQWIEGKKVKEKRRHFFFPSKHRRHHKLYETIWPVLLLMTGLQLKSLKQWRRVAHWEEKTSGCSSLHCHKDRKIERERNSQQWLFILYNSMTQWPGEHNTSSKRYEREYIFFFSPQTFYPQLILSLDPLVIFTYTYAFMHQQILTVNRFNFVNILLVTQDTNNCWKGKT